MAKIRQKSQYSKAGSSNRDSKFSKNTSKDDPDGEKVEDDAIPIYEKGESDYSSNDSDNEYELGNMLCK